jgi:hypothetical protein
MGRFVEGEDRRQSLLLPESLDDYVSEDTRFGASKSSLMSLILGRLALRASNRQRHEAAVGSAVPGVCLERALEAMHGGRKAAVPLRDASRELDVDLLPIV